MLFVLVETAMNTIQYKMTWWRHNCVTLHVTKCYFIKLLLTE